MTLFQLGDFTLASGIRTHFKIECDALTPADWDCLAHMILKRARPFREVLGVPRGGLQLQYRLEEHVTDCDHMLYVDDVWTTGGSMMRFIEEHPPPKGIKYTKAVVFHRGGDVGTTLALFKM